MNSSKHDNSILEILAEHLPAFQLKSGNHNLLSSERLLSQSAQVTSGFERASHSASLLVLEYISKIVTRDCVTLETGGGWSTCVFAAYSGQHVCINPDITANEMIQKFLTEHNVMTGQLLFFNQTSDAALPRIAGSCSIDVAFIDGNHSFPIPIVDWHYIDLHLKEGGILIVDDTHINSVKVLSDFLSVEESYVELKVIGNAKVFKKVAAGRVWGWGDQLYNKKTSESWLNVVFFRLKSVLLIIRRRLYDSP